MALVMVAKLEREQLRGLVEPHWRRLYNFMFRLTLDRDRAERYLSDVFASAADKIATRPAADSEVEVWLLGIANQLSRSGCRGSPKSTSTASMTRFVTRPRVPTSYARSATRNATSCCGSSSKAA